MALPTVCDRCHADEELALCLADFAYLCVDCWGTEPGTEYMCQGCARELVSCPCRGTGCGHCRGVTVGVVPNEVGTG